MCTSPGGCGPFLLLLLLVTKLQNTSPQMSHFGGLAKEQQPLPFLRAALYLCSSIIQAQSVAQLALPRKLNPALLFVAGHDCAISVSLTIEGTTLAPSDPGMPLMDGCTGAGPQIEWMTGDSGCSLSELWN